MIGAVGTDNQGLSGLEAGEQSVLGGTDGEEKLDQGRARRADPARHRAPGQRRARHQDHPRLGDPGAHRAGPCRGRRGLRGEERHRDRHGPAQLGDPRDGQLAPGRPRRPRATPTHATSTTRRPASPTSRARPSRPSPSPAALEDKVVTPDTSFYLPPTIKVADRTIEESHARRGRRPRPSPRSSPSPRTSAR